MSYSVQREGDMQKRRSACGVGRRLCGVINKRKGKKKKKDVNFWIIFSQLILVGDMSNAFRRRRNCGREISFKFTDTDTHHPLLKRQPSLPGEALNSKSRQSFVRRLD